nr:hypothetical protein [Tanacetum cinerariifolium]
FGHFNPYFRVLNMYNLTDITARIFAGQHAVMLAAMASRIPFSRVSHSQIRAQLFVLISCFCFQKVLAAESVTTHRLNTHPDAEDLGFVMRTTTTENMGIASVSQQGDCSFYSNDQKRRRFESQTNVDAQTLEQVPAFVQRSRKRRVMGQTFSDQTKGSLMPLGRTQKQEAKCKRKLYGYMRKHIDREWKEILGNIKVL